MDLLCFLDGKNDTILSIVSCSYPFRAFDNASIYLGIKDVDKLYSGKFIFVNLYISSNFFFVINFFFMEIKFAIFIPTVTACP